MNRGYKYKLQPTAVQAALFRQWAGTVRTVYNAALEQRSNSYRPYKRKNYYDKTRHMSLDERIVFSQTERVHGYSINYTGQCQELTRLRQEIPWIRAVSSTVLQQGLRDLDTAFSNFFKGKAGYPVFKKKFRNDSFRFQGRDIETRKLNRKWSEVKLPKLGWVKYRDTSCVNRNGEIWPREGTLKNATIRLAPDGWHIAFSVEIEHEAPVKPLPGQVGIDLGVAKNMVLSTGEIMNMSKVRIDMLDRRERKARKKLARKKRGSKKYAKQRRRVAAIAAQKARVRKHWQHEVSKEISNRFGLVVIEDLKVRNMTASAKGTIEEPGTNVAQKKGLNRSILNQGWGMLEAKIEYKVEEQGGHVYKVPAQYTSQTCSECGTVDKKSRKSQSSFECRKCGHSMNADHNAAINILAAFSRMPVGSDPPSLK